MSQAGSFGSGSSSLNVLTLTGNSGGAVGPTAGNINVVGDGTTVTVVGVPGTSTLTISTSGAIAGSFPTDSGTATPALGVLNIFSGATTLYDNINTAGAGNTVSVKLNDYIRLPATNAALTEGNIQIAGNRFLHAYGTDNTFLGRESGNTSLTGNENSGGGKYSLRGLTSGSQNSAWGSTSAPILTTANNCNAFGYQSQQNNLSGSSNCSFGSASMGGVSTGSENCAFGHAALQLGNGLNNSAFGFQAANGASGSNNVAIGHNALSSAAVNSNCAIGTSSLERCTSSTNSALGHVSASFLLSGTGNLILGASSGSAYVGAESNNILLMSAGVVAESGKIRIGINGTHTATYVAGIDGVNVGSVAKVVTMASDQLGTASITAGAGIVVTPGANTITISTIGGGLSWSVIAVNQTAAVENGYFCNKAGTLALALPATSAVGDEIAVTNENTALGVQFTQAAGQQILIGNTNTTLGATGTLTSTAVGDTLILVCKTANTIWRVTSMVGNWTPA